MGPAPAWTAVGAGLLVVLLTVVSRLGPGPDLTTVAALGLLVSAGSLAVGFASRGTVRQLSLTGAGLGLVPVVVLAGYLAG